ncbi:hypothetical protein DID88_005782 [Monilinia fructigena]|uniref:Protein YIP n=1 Tax=Monilinia fructigena TaxID=38457 RepID=A0A395J175_9HELO|nr:hypothetical protein DID88_005782 [Monilinia fructigena]
MSGAGYDVVVDVDEEGDLGHTDLQEDLSFHNSNFENNPSSSRIKPTSPGLPAPATAGGPSSSKRYLWSLHFYSQFFDVDTSSVLARCWAALYPRANFLDVLEGNPDLYGPFWIATTKRGEGRFAYDFGLLSGAAGLIYGYTFIIPILLFLALKYFGSESANLLEMCRSLWLFQPCMDSCGTGLLVLLYNHELGICGGWVWAERCFPPRNLYPVLSATDKQTSKVLLILVVVLHAGLAIAIKVLFFAHGSPVAKKPWGGPPKDANPSRMLF